MDSWINFDLLRNPVNWIVIALVLIFGAFGLFMIAQNAGILIPTIRVQKQGS